MFGREQCCVIRPASCRLGIHCYGVNMSTEFCQKCQKSHPGRLCDYDDLGECAETVKIAPAETEPSSREVAAETEGSQVGRHRQ